ncbi:DUF1064 domain-containing protein [Pseudomonas luteola]
MTTIDSAGANASTTERGTKRMSLKEFNALLAKTASASGKRASKYNAQKVTIDGITFDSKGEARRYSELKFLVDLGEITEFKRQVVHDLIVNGQKVCSYKSDFEYRNKQGEYIIEDFKGFRTQEYIIKRNLMKALKGVSILETGKKTSKVKK